MWSIHQNCKQNLHFPSKQMCRYISLLKIASCKTISNKAHSRKTQHPAKDEKHRKYSEIPKVLYMNHPFKCFTYVFEKGLMVNQRKIILTINCQIPGANAAMNSNTLLKGEWGKEEEMTVNSRWKLKAALLLSNEE